MAEFKRGQKHLKEEHHFTPALPPEEEVQAVEPESVEAVVENPTLSQEEDVTGLVQMDSIALPEPDIIESEPEPAVIEHTPSPAEQKIQKLVGEPVNGWKHIESAARNGMPLRLSLAPEGDGIVAYWKRTRSFNAKRWQETGIWCDFITTIPLAFSPLFWKPRFD